MKITVNKAKIKKLASFAKLQKHGYFWNNVFIHNGRAWALNGMAVICCECETTGAESLKIDAHAFFELIEKAGNGKEITIDTDNLGESWYSSTESSFRKIFDELTGAPTLATISRMLWALLQPKGTGERCNLLLTNEQVKAELREQIEKRNGKKEWQFRGGCELAELNQIENPLLLNISEKKIPPLAKKKSCCFSVVHDKDRNQYYLKYEGEMGKVYLFAPQYEVFKTANKDIFSDEIQAAYQSAIEQMKEQSEPTTEPEPIENEPVKPTESEESKMQEKKEIEPTEPTMEKPAAEPIQNEEIQTSETTPEPTAANAAESQPEPTSEKEGGGAPGWTGKADYQERREAKIERREERAAELRKEAERLRESVPDDWNYWTQPIHNTAGGRAFARSRQRELNKIDKSFEMDKKADYLESRGQSTAISSDDPEALDKLRAKLQALKENHEKLKAENKRRRQAGEEPFPWYTLQYSNRDIKRIEDRIKELETRQNTTWKKYKFDGGEIIPNVEENRYQIFHDEKPEQSIIDFMKSHGWRWSKYNRCWQRLLNRETVRCIESSGKWGYMDYLPNLRVDGADEPQEPEQVETQTQEPQLEPIAEPTEPENEQKQEPAPVVETEPEPESDNINPQPEKEQKEMQTEKQTETKHEPELPANFPPAAVRLDPLELWGEPLDYSRVQVIKHNAQECGLALMVYNVKGEGALFAMLPSFWAIVKERSQFDETAQRFIEDNFESVICFFDKEPEGGEIEPEPGDLARNWMQDAAEVKRETVSIPAPVPVPAPVVACKVDAPVQIPEPEPKQKAEKPTWTELKYALSLLAMEFSIDDLISKFLKKTSKPVRKSVVEKLLFEIDRGSVPKPGESKREYIKTYYQTH